VWVDDPHFNARYHIRHTALPEPAGEEELRKLAGRLFSQALDRTKPLWEIALVDRVGRDEFALICKTHHALVDGVSGVDIMAVLFDLEPDPPARDPAPPWYPRPEPTPASLLGDAIASYAEAPTELTRVAAGALASPGRALRALGGAASMVRAGLGSAPPSPLNAKIGPHRRFTWVEADLDRFKAIKGALGGTVNDVVLTVVAGGLRSWLQSRGVRVEGLELRALVPVSIRTREQRGSLGNQLAVMRGPLPVYVEDPIARLKVVRASMDGLKESKQALGAEVLAGVQNFTPPTVMAQASRLNFSTRLFNLLVTNVPGPQFPLYVLGRELQDLFPVAFLPKGHALAVAVMSYDGGMDFGLLGDYDAMPDLEELGVLLSESVEELLELSSPARTSRPRTSSLASTEA